jgi:hypothetical protein
MQQNQVLFFHFVAVFAQFTSLVDEVGIGGDVEIQKLLNNAELEHDSLDRSFRRVNIEDEFPVMIDRQLIARELVAMGAAGHLIANSCVRNSSSLSSG